MKLPNGYGTVYKLSGNRRNPWIARKTIGWDKNGKQLYDTIGYYATHPEGLEALAHHNKKPLVGKKRDITLGALYDKWFNGRYVDIKEEDKEGKLKSKQMYETAWNHLSALKDERVRDIKTSDLQAVIKTMSVDKKLSYSSCNKVKVLSSMLFKNAMAEDIVDKNYAEFVELPSQGDKPKDVFSKKETAILEANDDKEWVDTILMFIRTGMRISEMLKLKKTDVNIEKWLIVGGVKTDAGKNRVIPIHTKIRPYVKKWYDKEGEYLITRNGEKINQNYYRKYLYYPVLEELKIRRLTPHKARHTFATRLAEAGASTKAIQDLMGHAEYSTSAEYTHLDIEELRKAVEMFK